MSDGWYLWRGTSLAASDWVCLCRETGCTRLVVKAADGLSRTNVATLDELSRADMQGVELHLWAWCYPRQDGDRGGREYVRQQGEQIASLGQRYGARSIALNLEEPWSASALSKWGPGHIKAWGIRKSARAAELAERAGILIDAAKAAGVPVAVCTFPHPTKHALPFRAFARHADQIHAMVYTGKLGEKVTRSRAEWAQLGVDVARWVGPATKSRGAEGVRSMRLAVEGAPCDWWELSQAPADVRREMGG